MYVGASLIGNAFFLFLYTIKAYIARLPSWLVNI